MRVFEYPNGYAGNSHRHREAQLVYPLRGVVSVNTQHGEWLASPLRGVAIPAWTQHRVSAEGNAVLHNVLADPSVHEGAMPKLSMVNITPLLHELIKSAGRYYVDYQDGSLEDRVLRLIIDLLKHQDDHAPAWLPQVSNARIRHAIEDTPIAELRSARVAVKAAYSQRHFARKFREDTGMPFKDWRATYRVHAGMRLLARDQNVSRVAEELGFSSSSAFIAVFKKHTGLTPTAIRNRTSPQIASEADGFTTP